MMSGSHMMSHGKNVTLTGNVVDLSCYVGSGLHGTGRAACVRACLLKANRSASKPLTVTGTEFSAHGVTGIRIDTIAGAK